MAQDEPAGSRVAPRAYRSTLRDSRAAQTREQIVSAARALFSSRGFAGTTVASLAAAAGVATPTVYAVFGSKDAIMRELVGRLENEAHADRWRSRIAAEPDPRRKLAVYARWHRELFSRGRDVFTAAAAAGGDGLAEQLRTEGAASSRAWLDPILTALVDADALRPGLTRARAADRAWMLTRAELYLHATDACGWSDSAYERWLAELLQTQLLAPSA